MRAPSEETTIMIRKSIPFFVLIAALCIPPTARSDVIPIDPFSGTFSEDFNSQSEGAHQQLSIMGGFGTVTNLTDGGALKVEYSSSLDGVLVVPHSPPLM